MFLLDKLKTLLVNLNGEVNFTVMQKDERETNFFVRTNSQFYIPTYVYLASG